MSRIEPDDLPADVIARALEGERAAFRLFYERYDPTLRWAVGPRIWAWPRLEPLFEDVVQDVWSELMRRDGKRLRYHTGGVPFWRYLAFISARLAWRLAKRHVDGVTVQADAGETLDDEDERFVAMLLDADFVDRLAELVDQRLDDVDRAVFHGYYVEGETLKHIAARLGIKKNTAHKRHERLLPTLRALARELGEDVPAHDPELVAVLLAVWITLTQVGLGGGA